MDENTENGSQEEIKTDDPGTEETDAGQAQDTPDYGGFDSPEALVAEYTALKGKADNLESLKGRQGNELGELRSQVSKMEGIIDTLKESNKPVISAYDPLDLERQYSNGEITLGQFLEKRDEAIRSKTKEDFKQELGNFKSELDRQTYVDRFIADNPGYTEAYERGDLSKWINRGMAGEDAWREYKYDKANSELETITKERDELKRQVESGNIQTVKKIKQGEDAAGRVLGNEGDGTSFSRGDHKTVFKNHEEQVDAAYDLIQRMGSS